MAKQRDYGLKVLAEANLSRRLQQFNQNHGFLPAGMGAKARDRPARLDFYRGIHAR